MHNAHRKTNTVNYNETPSQGKPRNLKIRNFPEQNLLDGFRLSLLLLVFG